MMGTAETATAPNQKGELVDHNKKYELTQHLVPFTNLLHIVKLLLHFFLPDLMKTFFFFFPLTTPMQERSSGKQSSSLA